MNPTFKGELQLAGWAESHTGGAKVTFWLPDAEALDVFRGLTTKRGNKAGQRFMAALVEIGDDEKPVPNEKPKGGELARLAGKWCNDDQFRWWLLADINATAEEAAEEVRAQCGVQSRAELDHNPEAAQTFHREIREPFMEWCRDNGVVL